MTVASPIDPRKSWHGAKRWVKAILGRAPLNRVLVLTARRFLSPSQARRLPVAGKEVHGQACGSRFVLLNPRRCTVAKELYWGNGTRPRPEEHLALALVTRLAGQADVLLDVGAYSGIFTVAACRHNASLRAHAFEIVPEVYHLLFDNCVRNDILHQVTCHHTGLGAPETTVTLPVSTGGSSLPTSLSARTNFDVGVRVGLRTLDSLLPDLPDRARLLIKIDVEGTENEIFEHGQGVLERYQPDILCEVLASQSDPEALEAFLAPHGYRFYLVTENGLRRHDHIEPSPHLRDWFVTAVLSEADLRPVVEAEGGVIERAVGHAGVAPREADASPTP